MKKRYFLLIVLIVLFFSCNDNPDHSAAYTSEYVDVFDTNNVYFGRYLHYFAPRITGLDIMLKDLNYTSINPPLSEELIVADVTFTLSPNVTYAMREKGTVFAGTFYYKNENGSFPIDNKEGQTGRKYFLMHIQVNNNFYSGVYEDVGDGKLEWSYIPDWLTPIGTIN